MPFIGSILPIGITGTPVLNGVLSIPYAGFSVSGSGGFTPYLYSVTGGTLPNGLSLNASTGQVSGTPSLASTFSNITITVTDSAGRTKSLAPFSVVVNPSLSISGTPITTAQINVAYPGFTVSGSGGKTPYVYSIASGTLPNGLTINSSTGAVTGTPSLLGLFSTIVIRVTDANSSTANLASFSITISV